MSGKKTQGDYLKDDIRILAKQVKELTEQRDSLGRNHVERLRVLDQEHEKKKLFYQDILESFEKQTKNAEATITSLDGRKQHLENQVSELEGKMRILHDKYASSFERLTGEIAGLRSRITGLRADIGTLEVQKSVSQTAFDNVLGLRNELTRESDELATVIYGGREELVSVKNLIFRTKGELGETRKQVDDQRGLVLANISKEQELQIREHDVGALEYRLQPEFQKLLKSYLQPSHG